MNKAVEIDVHRIYVGFGYFFEWFTSCDGDYANKNIQELWIGRENIGFKTFCIAFNFNTLNIETLYSFISTQFAYYVTEYQERFADAIADYDEGILTPANERELSNSEMDYTLTRVHLDDYSYYEYSDIETLDGYMPSLDFWVGRVGSGLRLAIETDKEFFSELEEGEARELTLESLEQVEEVYNIIDDYFDAMQEDMDANKDEEDGSGTDFYFTLGKHINHAQKVLDSEDEDDLFDL